MSPVPEKDKHEERRRRIAKPDGSTEHIYEELQNYISAFTLESPRSKAEAAVMKVELYKAAFPHGALSKGTTIRGTYTYGGWCYPIITHDK